jgi:DNA-binding response OmpR family regulator
MNVIIIDDDRFFTQTLAAFLKKSGIQTVAEFELVSDALLTINETTNVIILDHDLYGLQGLNYISSIRKKAPQARIFYVSAQTKIEVLADAKFHGAEHYFQKNKFTFSQILHSLNHLPVRKKLPTKNIFQSLKKQVTKNTKPLIFMLDDDLFFAMLVRAKITKSEQFEVELYQDRTLFFSAISEKLPSIVILDYHLNGETGKDVLVDLKKTHPEIKVIMLTAQREISTAIDLLANGATDYIVKNNHWESRLFASIQRHLN